MSDGPGASSEATESAPRRRVGGYQIIRQIGRGGMAIVYLARQENLDRDVALKELSSFHASAPEMAERFLRESRLAGSLNHPNIVTVLEYFEDGGIPYIAMEYVPRGSLRPYVGRLSLAQFAGVMEGVLAGLAHADTYGIVHRDLKPENLMVTGDGTIKIADFGIAKATQSAGTSMFATATGTTVGTPTYMAPEQAMAQGIGIWTDLYSVGVMAWEHLVGRVPFHDTEAPMVILMRHVNEEIPSAAEVQPDIDPQLSAWIDRLLVKDAEQRTRSPIAAWEDLEEIVIGRLGPRWRRKARLSTLAAMIDTPRPLTPAPFESQRARTPPPLVEPAPEPSESGYVTFGRSGESPEPEPVPPPRLAPEPEPPVAEAEPVAEPEPVAGSEPVAEPEPEPVPPAPPAVVSEPPDTDAGPADGGEQPAPALSEERAQSSPSGTYVTFGRAPQPPAEIAPADRPAPIEPGPPAPPAVPEPIAAGPLPAPPEGEGPEAGPHPGDGESEATPVTAGAVPDDDAAPDPSPTPAEGAIPAADLEPPEDARLTTIAPIAVVPLAEAPPSAAEVPASPAAVTAARDDATASPARRRPARTTKVSARAAAAAAIAALVAIAAGYLVAPSSQGTAASPPKLSRTEVAGPIMLSVPAAWGTQRLATPHVNLTSEIAVGPPRSGGVLAVGVVGATDPSLLPAGLLPAVEGRPRTVVTLSPSGAQFYRYGGVVMAPGARPRTVYALPTSAGAVIGICAPGVSGIAFEAECQRVLGTLTLEPGTIFALGPSRSLAMELNTITSRLQTEVGKDAQHLAHARTPTAQASAAGALARDYRNAAAAVPVKVNTLPETAGAIRGLSQALRATGDDFAALQRAAASNNASAYGSARTSINASTIRIQEGEHLLATWGYGAA